MAMTSKEAIQARERLGLSVEDLAAELGFTPHVVQAWETGTIGVPEKAAKDLRWQVALLERHDALVASGLPECAWMAAWHEEEFPAKAKAQTAHMERFEEHLKSCDICKAREQFIVERFGELPKPPMSAGMSLLFWIGSFTEKLPAWARPAVWGALAFGAYAMLRIVVLIPALIREPRTAITALTGLSASLALGATLGLIYGGFQIARSKWSRRAA